MISSTNPFLRGFSHLRIERALAISYEDDCPLTYLPLHASQRHLLDNQVNLHPCIFCDAFALITEGQQISRDLEDQCPGTGIVRTIVYGLFAEELGHQIHVADTPSLEPARELIQQLQFETGHYSRCWEISSGHLTEAALQYLEDVADNRVPTGLLFEAFRIPASKAVGVKLIATPWRSQHLLAVDGRTAEQLYRSHLHAGMPEPLVKVVHMAALADTRLLIFDPDAPVLDGLPICEA